MAEHFNYLPDHNPFHNMQVSVVMQVKGGMATQQCKDGGLNILGFKFLNRLQNRDNVCMQYLSGASMP